MHVFTHLKPESLGKTGKGIHADGMVEHDGHVGQLLAQLDELGIARRHDRSLHHRQRRRNRAVAGRRHDHVPRREGLDLGRRFSHPDDGSLAGRHQAGTVYNDVISLLDWFPTLLAAAGVPDIKEQLAKGATLNGKKFKVHLDGYNFMPYFQGKDKEGPRNPIYYFDQGGNLNAIRFRDWKVSFATQHGNIATGMRSVSAWALIANLRMDPYERGLEEGGGGIDFLARQIWLLVPVQAQIKAFFADFDKYPYQAGASLNAGGINYAMLKQA